MVENQDNLPSSEVSKFASKNLAVLTVVLVAFGLMSGAHAEEASIGIDAFSGIMALITSAVAIVSGIGMAVLSLYATGKVFKWVRAAF